MSEYKDLVNALRELVVNKLEHKRQVIHGLLGNGAGLVAVPGRPDFCYVRPARGSSVVWEVFNKQVSGPDGWPILVGELPWQPGMVQVLGTDWSAYQGVDWGEDVGGVGRHARQHEWPDTRPGPDPVRIYRRAIEDLKTYPAGSGSLSVFISPFDYDYGAARSWPGVPGVDLSGAKPAGTGTARLMLTYLDPVTNTIGAWSGTVDTFSDAVRLERPILPTGAWIPSAYVRLFGGQGTVTERDIWDARRMFTGQMFTGTTATGPAGGDLTGTYPNPIVDGLLGRPLDLVPPVEGAVLMWSGSAWRAIPIS